MDNVCRTCLREPSNLVSLSSDLTLVQKIEAITSIQLSYGDEYPKNICHECVTNINTFYNFRKVILNSDKELRERSELLAKAQSETHQAIKFSKNSEPKVLTKPKKSVKIGKIHTCELCDKQFTLRIKLARHKRMQHVSHVVCNICGAVVRKDNIRKHIRGHYETPVQCKECGKLFKNTESLRGHMLIHKGHVYTCEFCGKNERVKSEFKRHLSSHVDPNYRKVACTLCGRRVKDMKRHMNAHAGAKPYNCEYCTKRFSTAYAVKVHTRQHTNERPYSCEYCGIAFPQKVSLMAHLTSKHDVISSVCTE